MLPSCSLQFWRDKQSEVTVWVNDKCLVRPIRQIMTAVPLLHCICQIA